MKNLDKDAQFVKYRARGRRRGSTIIMVAAAIMALAGCAAFAVDYGMLTVDANRLQKACDAAALSGANQLWKSGTSDTAITYDQYNAKTIAITVAARNGVTLKPEDITFPSNNKIRVAANYTRSFLFAPILGYSSGAVVRSALAGRMALKGVTGVVPLALTMDDYNAYKDGTSVEYKLIRNQDSDFSAGTVASLDLRPDNSGKSGAVFQDDLTSGYAGTIFLGQKIDNALTADIQSQGSKLDQAMSARFTTAKNAAYNDTGSNYNYPNYPADDARIMMIVVAPPNPAANNNPTLDARMLIPVYVESTRSPAGKQEYIRFRILPSYTFNSQNPNIVIGDDSTVFGGPSVVAMLQ